MYLSWWTRKHKQWFMPQCNYNFCCWSSESWLGAFNTCIYFNILAPMNPSQLCRTNCMNRLHVFAGASPSANFVYTGSGSALPPGIIKSRSKLEGAMPNDSHVSFGQSQPVEGETRCGQMLPLTYLQFHVVQTHPVLWLLEFQCMKAACGTAVPTCLW